MVDNALVTRANLYYGLEEIDARTNGSCHGISTDLQLNGSREDGTKESLAWVAPNDFRLDAGYVMKTSTTLTPMKYSAVKNPILTLHSAFYATGTYQSDEPPIAHECVMFFCVKVYNGSSMNGVFAEKVIDTWPSPSPSRDEHVNMKAPQLPPVTPAQWPNNSNQYPEDSWHTIQRSDDSITYKVDIATLSYLRDTIGWLLSAEIKADNGLPQKDSSETGRAIYKAMTGFATNLPDMVEKIAISMTNTVRNKEGLYKTSMDDQAIGEATKLETYVQVRWFWILVAITLEFLSLSFFLLIVRASSRAGLPPWKSSILAMLAIFLAHKIRSTQITKNTSLYDCEQWATGTTVRLFDSKDTEPSRSCNDQKANTAEQEKTRAHVTEQPNINTIHLNGGENSKTRPLSPRNDGRDGEEEHCIKHSYFSSFDQNGEDIELLEVSSATTSTAKTKSLSAT
ncbi:MAG: hypothetical protein Q9160_001919 [Pyrenula sp. 1 TL-2023]